MRSRSLQPGHLADQELHCNSVSGCRGIKTGDLKVSSGYRQEVTGSSSRKAELVSLGLSLDRRKVGPAAREPDPTGPTGVVILSDRKCSSSTEQQRTSVRIRNSL